MKQHYSFRPFILATLMFLSLGGIIACSGGEGEGEGEGKSWYDSSSGLTWQNPPTDEVMEWQEAVDYCENLTLGGQSDWHLPTINELRSLIRDCPTTEKGGSCGVTDSCTESSCRDDSCSGCFSDEDHADDCYWPSEMDGGCGWYWSSSTVEDTDGLAWDVYFNDGAIYGGGGAVDGDDLDHVLCVR